MASEDSKKRVVAVLQFCIEMLDSFVVLKISNVY